MTTLESVTTEIVDCEHKTAPTGDGYAYAVGTKAMKSGRIILEQCRPVSSETYKKWARRAAPEAGDLVLAREAPVGEVVRLPESPRFCLGQRTVLIKPNNDCVEGRFLHYWLQGPSAQHSMLSIASGATTPHLNVADIRALPIDSMPRDRQQQRVIGMILGSIDDLIENNRRRIEVLEEMAQAIYREWFVHFRFPGHENATFVDSPLGPIPEGWQILPFSDIATFTNGFAFKPSHWGDSGRPIIKIKELKNGVTTETPRCDETEINEKYWIEPGDLLFSWSADLGIYRWSGEPGLLNQHLFVVEPSTGTSSVYLQHALTGAIPKFWDRAQGTTMRHIKRSALTEVTAVVPPDSVDADFTSRVRPLDGLALRLTQTNQELRTIRDLLLPRLVSGEIDVSDLDLGSAV